MADSETVVWMKLVTATGGEPYEVPPDGSESMHIKIVRFKDTNRYAIFEVREFSMSWA